MNRPELVLASASPRRRALLQRIDVLPDRIVAPAIDETPRRGELPRAYAERMAETKADAVKVPGAIVLAADTVVAIGRRILPRAETAEQARMCLERLAGRRHRVVTALVLTRPDGGRTRRAVTSQVVFARLTPQQIAAYVAADEWCGKAGGYAIQGRAEAFVRLISGSYSNVVGLPLFETAQLLRGVGWLRP